MKESTKDDIIQTDPDIEDIPGSDKLSNQMLEKLLDWAKKNS